MSSWLTFMVVLLLCFSFNGVADARHRKQLHSSAIVVGTVYCDTCFRQEASKSTHFISGAKVAVECGGDGGKRSFRVEVKTNEKGEFEAKLPVSVGKSVERIKGCSVRLISSGEPYCAVAATATSSEIHFKSKKAGTHVFSAGFFTFKPELCNEKDSTGQGFPPALPDPSPSFLPPVGEGILPPLPMPDLPIPPVVPPLPLPQLPGVPLPPVVTRQKASESNKLTDQKSFGFPFPPPLFPPLPLVPSPPSLIPPVIPSPPPSLFPPLFPSPPPSLFPPLTPSPPSSLFPPLPFPPLPGLIPSPPPPPPPAFPIPLHPLPTLPPVPGFPTVPPAKATP